MLAQLRLDAAVPAVDRNVAVMSGTVWPLGSSLPDTPGREMGPVSTDKVLIKGPAGDVERSIHLNQGAGARTGL